MFCDVRTEIEDEALVIFLADDIVVAVGDNKDDRDRLINLSFLLFTLWLEL